METTRHYLVRLISVDLIDISDYSIKTENNYIITKLSNYVKSFGQITPIVVYQNDKRYKVIRGSSLYKACKIAGKTLVYCIDLGVMDDAYALLHYINLCTLEQDHDTLKIADLINKLLKKFEINQLADMLSYNIDDIEAFKNLLSFNWGQYDENKNQTKLF